MIARVFPRITRATPKDELTFFDEPPMLAMPEIDEVHISATFTYDIEKVEYLAKQWSYVGVPVKIGGPAFDEPGGEFIPGMYIKKGYTITSRGCPNKCWFCSVPKREGKLRELPIKPGYNVLDDNLLACSDDHVLKVFGMLKEQPQYPMFTGGLEAARLKEWQAEKLRELKTKRFYFAYDTPGKYEPLVEAGKILRKVGFRFASHSMCCYVLIGFHNDTFEKAEKRLQDTLRAGFMPHAMLYRDEKGDTDPQWEKFQRLWVRPAIIVSRSKDTVKDL